MTNNKIPRPVESAEEERFWKNVEKTDSCWNWIGPKTSHGYGELFFAGRRRRAHIVSKFIEDGFHLNTTAPGTGMHWDHLCRNRGCVKPEHLELVTRRTNIIRGTGPSALNTKKTKCPRGHELSSENMLKKISGFRSCKICHRIHCKRWRDKKREENRGSKM